MKSKNVYVSFMRVIMSFCIVLYHYNYYVYNWKHPFVAPGGYRCVEVFLVIAGYYLMKSIQGNRWKSFGMFMKQKLKRLYPAYIFVYILIIIAQIITHSLPVIEGGKGLVGKYKYIIFDIFLMQNWGIWDGVSVGGWYVSALLLGMILLYFLLTKIGGDRSIKLLWAIVIIGTFAITVLHGNLCVSRVRARFISMGVCRALIGLSTGCLAFTLRDRIRQSKILLLFSFGIILLEVVLLPKTALDCFILVLAALFMIESEKEETTFPGWIVKASDYFGRWSYIIFLTEGIVRILCDYYMCKYSLLFYVVAVAFASVIVDFVLNTVQTMILNRHETLKISRKRT